jgi:histone-lysine N-methyltransferase SETD3
MESDSFFYPYYDILPRTFANMPIQWSQSDLELLEGSELLEQIYDSYDRIEFDYNQILRVIGPQWSHYVGRITLEEFQWARMIITSRAFNIVMEGEPTTALVPLGDMINHHRPREMSYGI